ncbi:MAG: hypothetical protein IIZ78_18205 [Clostridiales bacterium]|nr:hypothetical protein [Clostridiales bacterium]
MIALDEDALICDFAETYHIYNMEQLSVEYVAVLAFGLRDSSRIKMKATGLKAEINTLLLAHIADNTAINYYVKTKDAKTGRNKPKSMVGALTDSDPEKHARQFDSGESFLEEWRRLNGN